MHINTEQSTCEKVNKLLYGTAKWIHDNDMHIESAIDIVLIFLFCLSHNRVFVHRAWRTSFMPCAVDILLWCDRKFPRSYCNISSNRCYCLECFAARLERLRLNLSRVRVVESITTDCLAGWLAGYLNSFSLICFASLNPQKNKLFIFKIQNNNTFETRCLQYIIKYIMT